MKKINNYEERFNREFKALEEYIILNFKIF